MKISSPFFIFPIDEKKKRDIVKSVMNEIEWKINEIAFDAEAKEFVKISNLFCPLCKLGDTKHQIKGEECAKIPFEAIALRFITLNQGKTIIGFTFRKVNADCLKKTEHKMTELEIFAQNPEGQYYSFIGRV